MYKKLTLLSTLFVAGLVSLEAAPILINSQAGLVTDVPGVTVAVTPHPAWQPNNPTNPGDPNDTSAVWISHKQSGYGESEFQAHMGMTPVVSIFHSFFSGAGLLNLNVWADDTADVYLDGVKIFSAVFTQSVCSGQPIGCRPMDAGIINTPLTAGAHELKFVLYQVGTQTNTTSNPFGLLYTGTAPTATPEPTALAMTGAGLVLVGLIRRVRNRKNIA